jgi:SAM-dependent methyltransferase
MKLGSTIYQRALAVRPLVRLGQMAVTGERLPRRVPLLAESVRSDSHSSVIDLGCGSAPLLRFVSPARYVGVDEHEPSLAEARAEHGGPGREFILAPLASVDLTAWRGADTVILSSVCHHIDDASVSTLIARIATEVAPGRLLVQDAEPTGPLGPLVTRLDNGGHLRSRTELESLLAPAGTPRLLWTYDNPVRSFHQFLYEVRPLLSPR